MPEIYMPNPMPHEDYNLGADLIPHSNPNPRKK